MLTYTLKVIQVRRETADTITLCFKQPGLKKIKYLAGQYLTLIFRINGRRYIRPYSFSSAPVVDSLLEITIKRVPNGIVSNHIHDVVKEGDDIEVMPPMGEFIIEDSDELRHICLWGTGSGITPLISIAKSLLYKEDGPRVSLFYGNRNSESTIFLEQIKKMCTVYPERFLARHFHTQLLVNEDLPDIIQGRISMDVAVNLLQSDDRISDSLHYICGAPGFKESVKAALAIAGVEETNVFSEDFELLKDPEAFKDIKTRFVGINFQDKDYNVEVVKGKSILEAALDANIELPYSCQTGSCSTCKGTKLGGDVKMIGLKTERADLNQEEYLLCCTHPVSENVYIKID